MKKIYSFVVINIFLSLFIIAIYPRFGRLIHGRNSEFYYVNTSYDTHLYIDMYMNADNLIITIMYKNKLSRQLTITCTDEPPISMLVQIDRGIKSDSSSMSANPQLQWALYDIISQDSSGSFFLVYWKSVIVNLIGGFLIHQYYKLKSKIKIIIKILILSIVVLLFIFSIIMSLRII